MFTDLDPGLQLLALATENQALKEELKATKEQLYQIHQAYAAQILQNIDIQRQLHEQPCSGQVTVEDIQNSHVKGSFKYYTGFDYHDFMIIFNFLVPGEN